MEDCRLRASENRVLRGIFGPKREEVARGWRRLHNEELHNLYTLPNVIRVIKLRRMRWVGHVVGMGEMKNVYNILVTNPEEKGPVERPRCRWDDNIEINLRETVWKAVDWIHLAQDRDHLQVIVNTTMNLRVS
jgi:acyl-CoA hydrolase